MRKILCSAKYEQGTGGRIYRHSVTDQNKSEEGKQSVQIHVDSVAKVNGAKISINKYVRYETGEGMEKKNKDFAAEVAAQMNA